MTEEDCKAQGDYIDRNNRKCAKDCPTGMFKEVDTKECVASCKAGSLKVEDQEEFCHSKCPEGTYLSTKGPTCLKICHSDQLQTGSCIGSYTLNPVELITEGVPGDGFSLKISISNRDIVSNELILTKIETVENITVPFTIEKSESETETFSLLLSEKWLNQIMRMNFHKDLVLFDDKKNEYVGLNSTIFVNTTIPDVSDFGSRSAQFGLNSLGVIVPFMVAASASFPGFPGGTLFRFFSQTFNKVLVLSFLNAKMERSVDTWFTKLFANWMEKLSTQLMESIIGDGSTEKDHEVVCDQEMWKFCSKDTRSSLFLSRSVYMLIFLVFAVATAVFLAISISEDHRDAGYAIVNKCLT